MFWKKKPTNIWQELKTKKPNGFFVLAPMADVTDQAFRTIINQLGRPDLFYTEFGAVDGMSTPQAHRRIKTQIFRFEKKQKPIIAQIFGGKPENYFKVAQEIANMGFDGLDLNTGCPQKNIVKQVCGAALTQKEHWPTVAEIIKNAKAGIAASKNPIPFAVKTRLGFNHIDLDWIKFLLKQDLDALTIHLRTKKEMSKVPAHWELAQEITDLKNEIAPNTVLLFNGDIKSIAQGRAKLKECGADGIMIGRGIFENPTLFAEEIFAEKSIKEKTDILLEHTRLFEKEFGDTFWNRHYFGGRTRAFATLKRFYKIYINGFEGAKDFREVLMNCHNQDEVKHAVKNFLNQHQ
ncbi:tRNA-dihydrouridine synthase [bacterium DOLZORAL124_38_8]|nr:MAG: tRNA-dihydrouridine synthase [bacterium DOLZORAL124_38_8]